MSLFDRMTTVRPRLVSSSNDADVPLEVVPASVTPALSKSEDIPQGMVVSADGGSIEIPHDRRADFVLIHVASNHVHLLVSQEMYGKAAMFDVRKSASDAGFQSIVQCATRDIIKIAYERLRSSVIEPESETDIEKLISKLVDDAFKKKASDIHIETRGEQADILFRINGIRIFQANLASETAHAIGKVLYSVHADSGSKDVTWSTHDVADGAIEWSTSCGVRLQMRFSSSPIYPTGNFQIVIRILVMESRVPEVGELGYTQEQVDMLDMMSAGQNGIVLLVGPTNSGKSTTLQSVIGRVFQKRGKEVKIITVEDPVEYVIPGACQIPISRKRASQKDSDTGSVYTTFLRGTLRQDPDVVLVGEIRDLESVMVTRDLVLAGRKVFATLHANSALWAFVRLREIGLPWEVLTMPGFIAGIAYQRLLPILCPHCARTPEQSSDQMTADVLHRLQYVVDFSVDTIRFRGLGCDQCNNTGISGRTTVAEMLIPDRTLLKLFAAKRFLEAESYWRNGSGALMRTGHREPVTVMQNAIEKMKSGLLSPIDIENQLGMITADLISEDLSPSGSDPTVVSDGGY